MVDRVLVRRAHRYVRGFGSGVRDAVGGLGSRAFHYPVGGLSSAGCLAKKGRGDLEMFRLNTMQVKDGVPEGSEGGRGPQTEPTTRYQGRGAFARRPR